MSQRATGKWRRSIGPPGTGITDRIAYLAAIDGIMYGDDPSDGSIRGTTFIHPRLGFLFIAPDGFVLENSAQAVLGVKAGGREALRLDIGAARTLGHA